MSKFVTVHMLQNLPLSRPNADDTGQQKDVRFGGFPRSRISSQCKGRAVRDWWKSNFDAKKVRDYVGVRTSFVHGEIMKKLVGDERAAEIAEAIVTVMFDEKFAVSKDGNNPTGYLIFTSDKEIDILIALVQSQLKQGKIDKKALAKAMKDNMGITVDVAMFGRMQACATNFQIYAARQMSHAVGVNVLPDEFDYFTAVDDVKEENDIAGAGHIDSLSCNSSCYYFHTTVDVDKLAENLGGDTNFAALAIAEYIKAFALSCPSGKQNSFAHNVLPDFVMVEIHDGNGVNLANAFESPVRPYGTMSLTEVAINQLMSYRKMLQETYGDSYVTTVPFICSTKNIENKVSLTELCAKVVDTLTTK